MERLRQSKRMLEEQSLEIDSISLEKAQLEEKIKEVEFARSRQRQDAEDDRIKARAKQQELEDELAILTESAKNQTASSEETIHSLRAEIAEKSATIENAKKKYSIVKAESAAMKKELEDLKSKFSKSQKQLSSINEEYMGRVKDFVTKDEVRKHDSPPLSPSPTTAAAAPPFYRADLNLNFFSLKLG